MKKSGLKKNMISLSKIVNLYKKPTLNTKKDKQGNATVQYKHSLPMYSKINSKFLGAPHLNEENETKGNSIKLIQKLNNTFKALKGSLKTFNIKSSSPKPQNKVIESLKRVIQESSKHNLHNSKYLYFGQSSESSLNSKKFKTNKGAQSNNNLLQSPLPLQYPGLTSKKKKSVCTGRYSHPLSLTLKLLNKAINPNTTKKKLLLPANLITKNFASRSTKQFERIKCIIDYRTRRGKLIKER